VISKANVHDFAAIASDPAVIEKQFERLRRDCALTPSAVILKRLQSDYKAIPQRFRSDSTVIGKRFFRDWKVIPQRLCSDSAAIPQ
jgi:hypothetical protein